MQIFSEYIQPLSSWLFEHPHWALLITFLISFSESLAIIGSIIPGTVTMTAIGILAGSGVMRIDLTLLAAALGAVAGDGISYSIGYRFRHSLPGWWPFYKYPHWLKYGQNYFAKHGGKSVLIGRFIGPLRSIIPVIAGMMHMNRWHFLFANVLSAIGWTILYVIPGVLIGAASSELTSENASRLFLLVLIILGGVWLASMILKWIIVKAHYYLYFKLDNVWRRLQLSSKGFIFAFFTPTDEENHFATAGLILLFHLNSLLVIILSITTYHQTLHHIIDTPVFYFLHSLQTSNFDQFFVFISLLFHPPGLIAIFISISLYSIYQKDWRTLFYWISLCAMTYVLVLLMNYLIPVPHSDIGSTSRAIFNFPDITLTISSSLFGFLMLYISLRYRTTLFLSLRIILFVLLVLYGFSIIYLSQNWLTSVVSGYLLGFTICLGHWIFYRIETYESDRSQFPILFSLITFLLVGIIYNYFYFESTYFNLLPKQKQVYIEENTWWTSDKTNLPLYTKNRIGRKSGLYNIRYVGSLENYKNQLTSIGWKEHPTSFFYALLNRMDGYDNANDLPIISQLYQNKKPTLVLTYSQHSQPDLVLQFWRSTYTIEPDLPLWIGTIHPLFKRKEYKNNQAYSLKTSFFVRLLKPEKSTFELKTIELPLDDSKKLRNPVEPEIIYIKNIE